MPGMGGQELYRHLRTEHPGLLNRLIFTTGDAVSNPTRAFLQSIQTPCVSKPFRIEDLASAIDEILRP